MFTTVIIEQGWPLSIVMMTTSEDTRGGMSWKSFHEQQEQSISYVLLHNLRNTRDSTCYNVMIHVIMM